MNSCCPQFVLCAYLSLNFCVLQDVMAEVIEQCERTLMSVNTLTGDPDFNSLINTNLMVVKTNYLLTYL